ncbi:hypothetical protein Shyd_73020 [Streptomyces hydrogenans]|uniref:Uncharacterized protein n=1 Tax=Streptomyces hydrogenans TaxID=1873719 RepID=A0ABQ3PLP2_9ACTN|nr:hypothetical protein [Streptomyces hydrogenans]GHI25931.1 hypothetical protein Shyd_73020 [Streptomyces hydrogenans]
MQDPVDHLPVIPPPAATPVADRQETAAAVPLDITQITPPHAPFNGWSTAGRHVTGTTPSRWAFLGLERKIRRVGRSISVTTTGTFLADLEGLPPDSPQADRGLP